MTMDLRRLVDALDPVCRRALEGAVQLCVQNANFSVEVEHLLVRLLDQPQSDAVRILARYDIDAGLVQDDLHRAIAGFRKGATRDPVFSGQLCELLQQAWLVASLSYRAASIRSGALVQALFDSDRLRRDLVAAVPALTDVPRDRLARDLADGLADGSETPADPAASERAETLARDHGIDRAAERKAAKSTRRTRPSGDHTDAGADGREALAAYTIDLTAAARAGRLDPVVGRDAEVRQVVDILMRRRQNNPILVGDPGVGKTAIVEGFAALVVRADEVPEALREVEVRVLDLGLLQAGASMRGMFESRLKQVIEEVQGSPRPVILFIDEAHQLIGAGGQAGQGDAANLLKPALARGELRTIAATTWAEYKKYFERDAALVRRFQVVKVGEPPEASAIEMVRGLVAKMEAHHGVRVLDEAVKDAVRLSHRYLSGRQLPDKAISVLDTACARVAIGQAARPARLEETERRLAALGEEVRLLEREQPSGRDHRERLQELTEALEHLEEERIRLSARWQQESALVHRIRDLEQRLEDGESPAEPLLEDLATQRLSLDTLRDETVMVPVHVDSQVVAEVISAWTGVPVGKMVTDEIQAVIALKDRLTERIVGQDPAMDAIARRIRTFRAGLDEPGKPTGVFLLVGPSGVGKTETAVSLAELLYGGERNMVTINMSEYQEPHTVSGLKGAPPGYVGYGRGGVLTEAVRRNPYAVVLLDEVEKAHPDVMELFYQVFDKGVLEDSDGVPVDFRNVVVLLTSNVAAELIEARCRQARPDAETLAEAIRPDLTRVFKPALLGRMVVVPYYPLGDDQLRRIVRLKLARIQERFWDNHRSELSYDQAVLEAVLRRCRESQSGARALDHILSHTLLPDLSSEILARLSAGEGVPLVHVGLDAGGNFAYEFQARGGTGLDRAADGPAEG
ncbi:ClpV1 family T6SS ATPase [Rhodovibrio sodomensis]|uniref:ClpV1 family T6SS ATPase n=1 Tax=Rhodovibrio sodomensis TaxID=1088 RepID=A0ABS1D9V9_9PROT|nr:type VI secretion system ATPase TssH [Rhodovibrio sodomensis]MBK1667150.1 ClpV1 family T6SS ATPase [Rhodovibrio sodomensis]